MSAYLQRYPGRSHVQRPPSNLLSAQGIYQPSRLTCYACRTYLYSFVIVFALCICIVFVCMIESFFYLLKSNVARCRNADNNQNRSWSPIFSQGGQRPSNRPHFLQTAICEAQRRVSSHHVPTFKNWFKMQSTPSLTSLRYGGRCPPPHQTLPKRPRFRTLRVWNGHQHCSSVHCSAVRLSPLWLSRFTTLKWSQSHNFTLGGRQWWFYPEIAQVQKRSKNLDKHLLLIWLHLKNLDKHLILFWLHLKTMNKHLLLIWFPLLQKFVVCNDKAMQIIHTINVASSMIANNVCKFNRAST